MIEEFIVNNYEKLYRFALNAYNSDKRERVKNFLDVLSSVDIYVELAVRVEVGMPVVRAIYSLGKISKFTLLV
jgi:hypothetical protein